MPRKPKHERGTDLAESPHSNDGLEVIRSLVNGGADTSRLLELYYWTREPGIVELIRAYLDMPERTQRNLSTFLLNGRAGSISSAFDQQGRLVLGRVAIEAGAFPADRRRQIQGT